MKTALRKGTISAKAYGLKAVAGSPGTFEAIVSVFGNVDLQGDRIIPGAFAQTLADWKSSGDPVPVIFSHQWDVVESHIGEVLDAKELLPGDSTLPPELKANGGLWTRFELDLETEGTYAKMIDRLLETRRVKEFSFAYDVLDERRGTDGANELVELGLIEVGPTLKGANPATRLLASALEEDEPLEKLAELLGAKVIAHTFAPGDEDPSRCSLCGMTRNTVAHNALAEPEPTGSKALVPVDFGESVEAELEDVYRAGLEWARGLDVGNGGFYALYLEATFPAEKRAVVLVEGWDDPVGEGIFFELSYDRNEAGAVELTEKTEIEIAVEVVRKSRGWKHRARPGSPLGEAKTATVPEQREDKTGSKAEDRETGKADDRSSRTGPGSDTDRLTPTSATLELAELELLS